MFGLHFFFFFREVSIGYSFLYLILPYYHLTAKIILLAASFCSWYYKNNSITSTHRPQGPASLQVIIIASEEIVSG